MYAHCGRANPKTNIRDKFYEGLHAANSSVSKIEKPYILRDFNEKVGSDNIFWNGTIGKYGVGSFNSNGLLNKTYAEHNLLIFNTFSSTLYVK